MLRDDINNAVKDAMKAKAERKLSTLRMVNSTIKNADIDARGQGKPPLSDADLLALFQKMIKQRQESVELYDKGGRAGGAETLAPDDRAIGENEDSGRAFRLCRRRGGQGHGLSVEGFRQ